MIQNGVTDALPSTAIRESREKMHHQLRQGWRMLPGAKMETVKDIA
ncbi:MAG: hypothetical protein AB7E27_02790 [Candidatus Methanomethylophilaceae archaeon]|jgi:hypothetical protein